MELIRKHIDSIRSLCIQHQVEELYLFGSTSKGTSNEYSDIDLLVRFAGVTPEDYFDNYMNLKEKLEQLLSQPVDLLEEQTLKNPVLIRSINRSKIKIYGREDRKVAI
ncbi:MAG: nucleotidyltransferase domain-containing protein [Bacteroidales bacterium]|nr:nucleotidyltransferase domain-containing protein [Bacteroidales bacterium]MCF8343971.1 nucleotidyltransferase domain-containing protein [Bacteroidales bacterium]MCF8350898.1 nucleotidyltransferase domain-containing protein [Bacteroidales bacterium]MCF8376920.1 nucleotidyltransferase domain-containing protein [Bacteroidales bacterium]MCF8400811.1 nucleotidyltransferase domain-containing protein [Bacteroidales bacterium]